MMPAIKITVLIMFLVAMFLWSERYKPLGTAAEGQTYVYDRWTGKIKWIAGIKQRTVESGEYIPLPQAGTPPQMPAGPAPWPSSSK